ncbi:type II CAAX prenyl endopeptidase Rce1 family protein [Haloarchaeobius amylolyticus]|uniref:Type II CAAX prenyl endopeptidase Rce1 family protein n=1 Tax=Haloarchaeobius amylolyticus TaxID=1198296 RepID=A0ABD6BHV0_9EURY
MFLVGGFSPLLAGLWLLWVEDGRAGLADLRRRLTDRNRIEPRWWLVIVLFYPAFNLLAAGVALATGYTSAPLEVITADRLLDPTALLLLVAVALVFPTIEEIGLRGYWFDQLQARWSALVASLILGVVWASWHVPLVYMAGYYEGTTFDPALWWWLPSIVLTAVIATWVLQQHTAKRPRRDRTALRGQPDWRDDRVQPRVVPGRPPRDCSRGDRAGRRLGPGVASWPGTTVSCPCVGPAVSRTRRRDDHWRPLLARLI